jgi:hypothetical protein
VVLSSATDIRVSQVQIGRLAVIATDKVLG